MAESGNQSNVNKHLLVSDFMARSTHVHDDEARPESFTDDLEQRARDAISSRSSWEVEGFSASSLLEDEIALTLHQLNNLRRRGGKMEHGLQHEESEINTELLQMEQRTPRYSPYRYPEREKLQRRRSRVLEQARRFTVAHADKLDVLHSRLLALLNRHRQVTIE